MGMGEGGSGSQLPQISSKMLEQKVNPLPVDVSLLQQLYKMHGKSMGQIFLNQQICQLHVIISDLL